MDIAISLERTRRTRVIKKLTAHVCGSPSVFMSFAAFVTNEYVYIYINIYTHSLTHMHTNVFCQVLHEKGLCKLYIVKVKSENEKETTNAYTFNYTHTNIRAYVYTHVNSVESVSPALLSCLIHHCGHITRHLRLSLLCIQNRQ